MNFNIIFDQYLGWTDRQKGESMYGWFWMDGWTDRQINIQHIWDG